LKANNTAQYSKFDFFSLWRRVFKHREKIWPPSGTTYRALW